MGMVFRSGHKEVQHGRALFIQVAAVAETVELSSGEARERDMGHQFPLYPIPEDGTTDTLLQKRTMEGVANRYGCKASAKLRMKAERQVERELALIAKLRLAGYFLIVLNIVEFCRKHSMLVHGIGGELGGLLLAPIRPRGSHNPTIAATR